MPIVYDEPMPDAPASGNSTSSIQQHGQNGGHPPPVVRQAFIQSNLPQFPLNPDGSLYNRRVNQAAGNNGDNESPQDAQYVDLTENSSNNPGEDILAQEDIDRLREFIASGVEINSDPNQFVNQMAEESILPQTRYEHNLTPQMESALSSSPLRGQVQPTSGSASAQGLQSQFTLNGGPLNPQHAEPEQFSAPIAHMYGPANLVRPQDYPPSAALLNSDFLNWPVGEPRFGAITEQYTHESHATESHNALTYTPDELDEWQRLDAIAQAQKTPKKVRYDGNPNEKDATLEHHLGLEPMAIERWAKQMEMEVDEEMNKEFGININMVNNFPNPSPVQKPVPTLAPSPMPDIWAKKPVPSEDAPHSSTNASQASPGPEQAPEGSPEIVSGEPDETPGPVTRSHRSGKKRRMYTEEDEESISQSSQPSLANTSAPRKPIARHTEASLRASLAQVEAQCNNFDMNAGDVIERRKEKKVLTDRRWRLRKRLTELQREKRKQH